MFWLLTGMQGKQHVWLLNLMNLFVGVRLSIVSFFLLVFQSFPWLDQNFWASNGKFCTLDNLSCSAAQFPNFLGRMTGFLGCFATPMAQACISDMFFQAGQVSVSYFLRNVGRALGGSYKCNAVNLLSIHARHTHTHTIPFRRRLLRVLQNQRSDYARKLCILRRHLLWNNYHHNHNNNYNDNVHRSANYPNYHDHSIRCFSGCVLVYMW